MSTDLVQVTSILGRGVSCCLHCWGHVLGSVSYLSSRFYDSTFFLFISSHTCNVVLGQRKLCIMVFGGCDASGRPLSDGRVGEFLREDDTASSFADPAGLLVLFFSPTSKIHSLCIFTQNFLSLLNQSSMRMQTARIFQSQDALFSLFTMKVLKTQLQNHIELSIFSNLPTSPSPCSSPPRSCFLAWIGTRSAGIVPALRRSRR